MFNIKISIQLNILEIAIRMIVLFYRELFIVAVLHSIKKQLFTSLKN
jgi:hypothetical protein